MQEHGPDSDAQSQRFKLPEGAIAQGRSQPKRTAPRSGQPAKHIIRRAALGIATFALALMVVAMIYGASISSGFSEVALENGTTAAFALLIGCFALPTPQRASLSHPLNFLVCVLVLAITPWTYQWGNQAEVAGVDLANGFNFIFEVLLAVVLYRIACRLQKLTQQCPG